MKKISVFIVLLMVALFFSSISYAVPPQPARIGGTVTINGRVLTQSTDSRLIIKVTKRDGTALVPAAEDTDGLSVNGYYLLDIPIYNATDQPSGVSPGTIVVIHVYKGSKELTVVSPANGQITVGGEASTTTVNISAEGPIGGIDSIMMLLLE